MTDLSALAACIDAAERGVMLDRETVRKAREEHIRAEYLVRVRELEAIYPQNRCPDVPLPVAREIEATVESAP